MEMLQMYNPAFLRRVWKKRRKAPAPPVDAPTVEQIQKRKRLEAMMRAEQDRRDRYARSIQIAHSGFDMPGRPNVKGIIARTAIEHGVSFDEVVGQGRRRYVVPARHAAMVEVCIQRPDMSLSQIGKAFGGRDHTTILHALRKAGFKGRSSACRHEMIATLKDEAA